MAKKRLVVKNRSLREVIRVSDKKTTKRNFLELLRRAGKTIRD